MRGEQIGRERVPVMVSFFYGGSRPLLRGSDDPLKQFPSLSKGFPLDGPMPVPVACFQRPGGLGQSISRFIPPVLLDQLETKYLLRRLYLTPGRPVRHAHFLCRLLERAAFLYFVQKLSTPHAEEHAFRRLQP